MADDRIREWAYALEKAERTAFAKARRRFLRRPSPKRLHVLRTAARRLNSLYEDLRDVLACKRRRRLRRLIALTGAARDAIVMRELIRASVDIREAIAAQRVDRALQRRERSGLKRVFAALLQIRIEAP
jgi:hypothetical protein